MKILALLIFTKFNFLSDTNCNCIIKMAETIISDMTYDKYFLFIPAQKVNGTTGRLMITKKNFIKLLVAEDSNYKKLNLASGYFVELLSKKKIFKYNEEKVLKIIGHSDYTFITQDNKYRNMSTKYFLRRFLSPPSGKDIYYHYIIRDKAFVFHTFEKLFMLNFLIGYSDGGYHVEKVSCN